MLTSWNKLCFTTGYIEVSVSLPGSTTAQGLWPGMSFSSITAQVTISYFSYLDIGKFSLYFSVYLLKYSLMLVFREGPVMARQQKGCGLTAMIPVIWARSLPK